MYLTDYISLASQKPISTLLHHQSYFLLGFDKFYDCIDNQADSSIFESLKVQM